jgi:hypothetical protein
LQGISPAAIGNLRRLSVRGRNDRTPIRSKGDFADRRIAYMIERMNLVLVCALRQL